ncbi:hypothetical protein M9Y10_008953 [Tritrichomonas musculus]|uniref:Uncharacterized protein n=1 Tax=Tritrichomonas musculus TaxID=1915356 RepID=A0ABR2IZI8_9EUKA
MSIAMERRLEQIQSEFQQHVNINDDNIARLADYLEKVKSEIIEKKDQLNRFNYQTTQAIQYAQGKKRAELIQLNTTIARMKAEHQSYLQALSQHQAEVVQSINTDFEHSLSEVESYTQNKIIERVSEIEQSIKRVQKQIENMKITVQEASQQEDSSDDLQNFSRIQNCEIEKIKNLENALKEKNKDRLASLLKAKKHLSNCVSTLEELEQEHSLKMEKFKTQLELIDSKYEQKLQADTETQRKKLEAVTKKLVNAENATDALQKKIDEENSKHQEKMLEIGQNLDQYRSSINSLTSKPAQSKENKDFQNAILHLEELKALLTEREGILYQERSTNEALKKEINRLRDEALIIQRRAALNIS